MNEERNIRNSDLKFKDTFLIYKTVAKWYFFTSFIYANHIFNRLNSLQHGLYSLVLYHIVATSNLKCKIKKLINSCKLLLNDLKEWGLVGQFYSFHHWHAASCSGDCEQWKQQDTAAKAVTCTSDTLQTIYNDTEYNMSCWALVNYPYCGTYLMQFNVAKPFISMLKYAQQYTINITWRRVFYWFI